MEQKLNLYELYDFLLDCKGKGKKNIQISVQDLLDTLKIVLNLNKENEMNKEMIAILNIQKLNLVEELKKFNVPDHRIARILNKALKGD